MGQITQIVFSPGGTTALVAETLAKEIGSDVQCLDLLKQPLKDEISFSPEDIVVVAMPVFAGRIPSVCPEMLNRLKGNGASVIAAVVYGNRAYEDALLELCNAMTENGFTLISAGAFVARHSVFPAVASGRPDASDMECIRKFAQQSAEKIKTGGHNPVEVKGNYPYREIVSIGLVPSGNSACTHCGLCASLCPVGAIDKANPQKTNKEKCISCTACIYQCPSNARSFTGLKYRIGKAIFPKKCSAYSVPEVFI